MTLRDKLFGFEGRLSRGGWWGLSIAVWAATLVGAAVSRFALFGSAFALDGLAADDETRVGGLALSLAVGLVFLWPTLAFTAKRAHDTNRNAGPIVAVAVVGKVLAWAISLLRLTVLTSDALTTAALLSLPVLAIQLYLLVILGFLPGTPGPNRFGLSPLGLGPVKGDPASAFD